MSDRPITDHLGRIEAGETLEWGNQRLLAAEVRMLLKRERISDELCEAMSRERDEAWEQLAAARARAERLRELVRECRLALVYGSDPLARERLLQRIEAELGKP